MSARWECKLTRCWWLCVSGEDKSSDITHPLPTHIPFLAQIDMQEARGVVHRGSQERRKLALQLAVGALVAGGDGATAVPYSSVGPTMSQDFLVVLNNMESGFPRATAIRNNVLPNMVEMVKTFQDEAMKVSQWRDD